MPDSSGKVPELEIKQTQEPDIKADSPEPDSTPAAPKVLQYSQIEKKIH